jgi:DNA-binding IscR family transcriptional regulator
MELVDCVTTPGCPVRDSCVSRHTWSELYEEINDCIDSITLKDLTEKFRTMDQLEYAI